MRKNEYLQLLSKKLIGSRCQMIAMDIQYLLEEKSIYSVFRKPQKNFVLTPKRQRILEIMTLTNVSSQLLEVGGIYHLRSAQRELKNLKQAGLIDSQRFLVTKTQRSRKFYFLKVKGFHALEQEKVACHEIKRNLLEHDSITALFLVHLFRCSEERGLKLKWYPPFPIWGKVSDGGIVISQNGQVQCSLLIETDRATHESAEIKEKMEAYQRFLCKKYRAVIFLLSEENKIKPYRKILSDVLKERGLERLKSKFLFFCPLNFTPNTNVFHLGQQKRHTI